MLLPDDLLLMLLLTLLGRVTVTETSRIGTLRSPLLLDLEWWRFLLTLCALLLWLVLMLFDEETTKGGAKDGEEHEETGTGVRDVAACEDDDVDCGGCGGPWGGW